MNQQIKLLLLAFNKGYKVDIEGNIISPFRGFIKGRIAKDGRIHFYIKMEGMYPKGVPAHRLQAYQKFGDKLFEEGIVVRHLDGNPLNNSWDNIAIGTQSDNILDRDENDLKIHAVKASRFRQDSIRSYESRIKIYEDLKNGVPYSEIMKKHNVSSKGTLSFMKNKSEEYKEFLIN